MVFIHIIFICGCRFDATVTNLQSMSDNLRKEEMMMLNRIRKNGKRVLVFLIAALLLTMIPAVPLHADTVKDDTTIDFVLVLDCSGTMRDNDPEHWTEAAAKQFVNILGTENVRLAVIAMGHDYGNDAYPVGQSDPQSRNRVKVAFPLTKIGDNEQKKEAKDIIHEVTSDETRGTMTPIGYALQAAYEILDEGEAADGQAAVILLSDGQVDGQTDYVERGNKKDFKSIDDACDRCSDRGWKIYGMELNYAGENKEGEGFGGIAYHQMRENIPGRTETEPFEVKSAEDASQKLLEIYTNYMGKKPPEPPVPFTDKKEFTVGEMTAELSLILEGDISLLDSVELVSPKGTTREIYETAKGDVDEKLRKVYYSDRSVVITMIMPEEGDWTLLLHGKEGISITMQYTSVSLNEMNLVLTSDRDGSGADYSGQEVNFTASFEYAGIPYESAEFYKNNPAKLIVGDEKVEMESSQKGYEVSYTFLKKGTYETYAQVDSNFFKDGYRKSGTLSFNIENTQTKAKGEIPEQTCGIMESTQPIDLKQYFDAGDGDDLTFEVRKSQRDDFDYNLTQDGKLTLKAMNTSKLFKLTAVASDGSGEKGAEQKIVFRVTNQPLKLIKEMTNNKETIELVVGAGDASERNLTSGDDGSASDTKVLKWSEYFSDPDGAVPEVRILEDKNDGIVTYEQTDDGVTFRALNAGEAQYTIVAIDGNAGDVSQFFMLDITAETVLGRFAGKYKVPLTALVILVIAGAIGLILNFTGRKIYGVWDIDCDGHYEKDIILSSYKCGKKAKAEIDRILSDLGMEPGFPKACLKAGNQFGKKIYASNLENMDAVFYNDMPIDDFKKKPVEIRVGGSLTLERDGRNVTFSRISNKAVAEPDDDGNLNGNLDGNFDGNNVW